MKADAFTGSFLHACYWMKFCVCYELSPNLLTVDPHSIEFFRFANELKVCNESLYSGAH